MSAPEMSAPARAQHLVALADRTEGIHTDLICFVVARLLRVEGHEVQVCSQTLYHADRSALNYDKLTNEIFLCVGEQLVNKSGAYDDTRHLTQGGRRLWRPLRFYDIEVESDEVYVGWCVSPQGLEDMMHLLQAHDCAIRLAQDTPKQKREAHSKRL